MSTPLIQRPHYFSGEALQTQDFVCEQQYHMTIQSLNNRSLYTYGIATGLEVVWDQATSANQVEVRAGMAIDSLGRQIILLDAQVVPLTDVVAGATYFLTINYHQVFSDYEDQTGVAGYKRIVEIPQIRYVRNLQDPGLNILLAVIGFSTQGAINSLNYQSGGAARRYVSSSLGAVTLITEGAGVFSNPRGGQPQGALASLANANDSKLYPTLRARKEVKAKAVYLEVDATHTDFTGYATTHGNLGVGEDQPVANLQVKSITFEGAGTLTSNGTLVTISKPVAPFFNVGDVLISDPPVQTMTGGVATFGVSQRRTIVTVDSGKSQVTVNLAFDPPLDTIPYTYIRSTIASFSDGASNTFFNLSVDGTVGIGKQALAQTGTGQGGRGALMITPARQVGIALIDRDPSATLDVNGTIRGDALTIGGQIQGANLTIDSQIRTGTVVASGTVQAQSFEGNGAKLKNLPILSYWTRETVGALESNLYYNDGNVGILNTNPLASLSVGAGPAFVGKGVITSLSDGVVEGYQTAFKDQISEGDSITIGKLIEQIGVIAKVIDNDTLEVEQQFPIPLTNTKYQYLAPGSDTPEDREAPINSNGTTVIGKGANFLTTVTVGGAIVIKRFEPNPDMAHTLLVKEVTDQTKMTLSLPNGEPLAKDSSFAAATSAFYVSPSMLAYIGANAGQTYDETTPALVVTANTDQPSPNTVAINTLPGNVDQRYALQVNGDVNFTTSQVDVNNLITQNLTVEQSVTVDGTVQMIGTRAAYGNWALTNGNYFTQTAATDGYVMATVGQPTYTANYCGALSGRTYDANGNPTSFVYATGLAYKYDTGGKKSHKTYSIPVPGSFTMPVKKGERWDLTLTWNTDFGGAPQVEFYWIPLGAPPAAMHAMAAAAPAAPAGGGMGAMLDQLRDDLASGRIRASVQESAQRAISQRMDDLTQIFGDATGMSANADDRQRFMQELGKIVCSPQAAPNSSTSPEFAANVQSLIDVFERATGGGARQFTPEQRGLLAAGVRALVQINDNDDNRHDLPLIRNNIDLFIDNVQQVLQTQFDTNQRRLLTRALVRLVGDGSAPGAGT
ncbi:hypothetical protein AAHK20_01230 [Trinickia sp. YCB016]